MKNYSSAHLIARLALGSFVLAAGIKGATADVFTIDTNQTFLTISGSVSGANFAQQGPGSLTTKFTGTVQLTQTGSTVQFTGLSVIDALTNGSWQPLSGGAAGSAPADFGATASPLGGLVTVVAAMRSVVFDVTSPVIPLTGNQFGATNLLFKFSTNAASVLDYRATGVAPAQGTKALTQTATNNISSLGALTNSGNQQVLFVPVNTQFIFTLASANDTIVNLAGQLVATRSAATPLLVQSATVSNQVVTLKWQSTANQSFQVQSTTNFSSWQTNATVTSGTTSYSWTGTNTASRAFYRLAHY